MIVFVPELYTLIAAGVFFALSLASNNARRDFRLAFILSAVGLVICVAWVGSRGILFAGTYQVDAFSQVFKCLLYMGFFLVVCLCERLDGVEARRHSEFYLLLALCTLALMLLVSCVHLLPLYIALELSSYSLYILVYLRRGYEKGIESAIKYFIIGATASAVMLFGFALLYGTGQSGYLVDLIQELPARMNEPVVLIGFILSLSGFFFKLALFPFHFWAPDAYEGAPHQAAAYIATASKAAAIAVLLRLVALSGGSEQLAWFLIVLSIASMTIGNLAAVVQKDLKRLLAFSSVAHAGYVMIGILSMNALGISSAIFYALSLLVMKFACFMVVVKASSNGGNISISDLAGLHQRAPMLALALMLALFGLAGIPPTIGFTAKLLVFTAAMETGLLWLVLVAMLNVVISLYYYLLVIKAAYFTEPSGDAAPIPVSTSLQVLAVGLILVMILGGIYPHHLIELAQTAASSIGY
ncbi:MAG: NADH-quinone oxidoreductase subunit N [Desulfobacterales bacterium]